MPNITITSLINEENRIKLQFGFDQEVQIDLIVKVDTAYDEGYCIVKPLEVAERALKKKVVAQIINKFPEFRDNFPAESEKDLIQFFGSDLPSLEHCITEAVKNAIDSEATRAKQSARQTVNINLTVDVMRVVDDSTNLGNKYVIKIFDEGTGFNQVKKHERRDYTYYEVFTKNALYNFIRNLLYYCLLGCCDPLGPSTKRKNYLLGHSGLGLSHIASICNNAKGDVYLKNRKNDKGARIKFTFFKEGLNKYQGEPAEYYQKQSGPTERIQLLM